MLLPELGELKFSAPKDILNGMVNGGRDSEFVQMISKIFIKSKYEKFVNYV